MRVRMYVQYAECTTLYSVYKIAYNRDDTVTPAHAIPHIDVRVSIQRMTEVDVMEVQGRLHPPPAMSLAALHASQPILAQFLGPIRARDLVPPGERHDDDRHIVVAAHLFCEGEYTVGGNLRRQRSSCEVRDFFVRHD